MGFEHFKNHIGRGLDKRIQRLVGPSVVEGSAIAGRQLCIVLGFAWAGSGLVRLRRQERDVNLESFRLPLIDILSLPDRNRDLLNLFLFQANKSTAHLALT